jgi:hypothetical protein
MDHISASKGVCECVVEPLDRLIDLHGWAAVLSALAQIGEQDGFEQISPAVKPLILLIDDQSCLD